MTRSFSSGYGKSEPLFPTNQQQGHKKIPQSSRYSSSSSSSSSSAATAAAVTTTTTTHTLTSDTSQALTGGISNISKQAFKLAQLFYRQLSRLTHANGRPVAKIYCLTNFEDPDTQGPIVTFNILTQNETFVGYNVVAKMAAANNIHLRVGCFCNIGACQMHLGITTEQLIKNFQAGHVCGDEKDMIDGFPTGAVRISFGSGSTESDVNECIQFIQNCFIETQAECSSKELTPTSEPPSSVSLHQPSTFKRPLEPPTNSEAKTLLDLPPSYIQGSHHGGRTQRFLSHLFLYPVKSCAGMKVTKWPIVASGLLHDREWMIVTERGVAVTQKSVPKLCLIQPVVNLAEKTLTLHYPEVAPLQLSLDFLTTNTGERNRDCTSKVCFKKVNGLDCGQKASDWLSKSLGKSGYRLFQIYPKNNQDGNKESKVMSLSNHGQYSLVINPSLWALYEKVHQSPSNESEDFEEFTSRFRSNFVISGGDSFEERSWKSIRIGSTEFVNGKESNRCQMICINQKTAERTAEPLATLFSWFGNKVNFGVYFETRELLGEQILCTGDEVIITDIETEKNL